MAGFGQIVAWCGTGGPALPGLFLAGLAGGAMHCGPMCGGFVIGQVSDRLTRLPAARLCEARRLGTALLLPYHIGRLATYALLGATAATLGAAAGGQPWFSLLSATLLLLGAVLFAAHAAGRMSRAWRGVLPRLESAPPAWGRALARVSRGIDRGHWSGGLLLGLLLGFLPCGILYAALAVAAATGSPWRGALAMLAFGVGTMPSLFAIGLTGHLAGRVAAGRLAGLAAPVMLANAVLLALLAWQRLTAMA
jgi:sulfite exporter TauE/SafE